VHAAAPGLATSPQRSALEALGVVPHSISLARTGMNPIADLRTFAELGALMRRVRPSHVLTYSPKPVIYGSIAARLAGVEHSTAMITGLGYAFTSGDAGIKRRLLKRLLRELYRAGLAAASCAVFQNRDDLQVFTELGLVQARRCRLIDGSGINLDRFAVAPLPATPGVHFLLIARLLKDKGIYEFVAAARDVRRTHPSARFHLVGWLDTNPAAISARDLAQWVEEGIVTHHGRLDDVRPIIASCHVYVLPSYREGTPRTVLEAMSMARPVITTDAPGCRETVVEGRNGYLVPVQDAAALARAMRRFLDEPESIARFGAASRALAAERFDVRKVNARLLEYMGIAD
jgi:glycosyltransferase involved in cell wall biosynthesis